MGPGGVGVGAFKISSHSLFRRLVRLRHRRRRCRRGRGHEASGAKIHRVLTIQLTRPVVVWRRHVTGRACVCAFNEIFLSRDASVPSARRIQTHTLQCTRAAPAAASRRPAD